MVSIEFVIKQGKSMWFSHYQIHKVKYGFLVIKYAVIVLN